MTNHIRIILVVLLFVNYSHGQNDSLGNFGNEFKDSLFEQGIENLFVIQIVSPGSATGHGVADYGKSCVSRDEFIFIWKEDSNTKYLKFNHCCYSDIRSKNDSVYLQIETTFTQAKSGREEHKTNVDVSRPHFYRFHKYSSSKHNEKMFASHSNAYATQENSLYVKFLNTLNDIDNWESPFDFCKYRIEKNWH